MPENTFKSNDWETIEIFFGTPNVAPERRICTQPVVPLRLKVAFFVISSSNGCINYGGFSRCFYQRVQARGKKGQTIWITQTVPAPPNYPDTRNTKT